MPSRRKTASPSRETPHDCSKLLLRATERRPALLEADDPDGTGADGRQHGSERDLAAVGEPRVEIHSPEKPILTIKEAAVHLLIVTVGILIALSLEGIVEYVHHRTIVREAREIMRQEIESNRSELDKSLAHIKDAQMKDMTHGIEIMQALSAHQAADLRMNINYQTAS